MEMEQSTPQTGSSQQGAGEAPVNLATGGEGFQAPVDGQEVPHETPVNEAGEGLQDESTPTESDTNPNLEEEYQKKEDDFARRFAALTRKEREFLARERAFKEQASRADEVAKKIENMKNNPLAALEEAGWKFKDLADFVLNNNEIPAERKTNNTIEELREQVKSLTERLDEDKKSKVQQEHDRQINEFKQQIKSEVSGDLDKYELINVNEAHELVYDVIESHFQQTMDPETGQGQILDIHQAAEQVEKHLEEQLELQAQRFKSSKKFSAYFKPSASENAPETNGAPPTKIQSSPTLSNRQTGATPPSQVEHYLSDEESKAAAARFLEESLRRSGT